MEDLSDKGSECDEVMKSENRLERGGSVSSDGCGHSIKTCADCGTTKTPLWRGGPAGPKSLCNACGIRSRKKKRAILGISKDDKKPKKTVVPAASSSSSENQSSDLTTSNTNGFCLKKRILAFSSKVVMQRPRSKRRKIGEEEQAAILLMALSCGSCFA